METESPPDPGEVAAPAVVAVVVSCDPGPWFEDLLSSLVTQDYPNLSILVIDSASSVDPTPRIAEVIPSAFVTRLEHRVGFGRAANEVLKVVEGASHLLLCHDDVALAPGAVRLMVEEAFRSNAGVVTPKYVQWDQPDRLLAVGATADKVGVVQQLVDPGELDQSQHDGVREVFIAPGGATLVRADLFRAMGGFNATIDQFGEDLDLSWRARIAGARVVVAPAAKVQHLQAITHGAREGWDTAAARRDIDRLTESHRVRTMLTCYRWFDLVWIAPLAVLYVLGEASTRLLQGHPGDALGVLSSFASGFQNPLRLWRSRRRVQSRRRAGDAEIRKLQARGNARFRAFVRARVDDVREGLPPAPVADRAGEDGDEYFGRPVRRGAPRPRTPGRARQVTHAMRSGASARSALRSTRVEPAPGSGSSTSWRLTVIAAVALVAVIGFGSRSLLGHELPALGQVPNTSNGLPDIWRSWWSTWQPSGLGVASASSPGLALLGLLGTVLFGAVGTLQHFVVLGPLLIGPLGAYRAARWWGSRRGRVAAMIAYAIVPLPYNAIAFGHWPALVVYAALPWIFGMIGRLSGEVPFPRTGPRRVAGRVIGLGLLVAGVSSVAPVLMYVMILIAVALVAGSAVTGRYKPSLQMAAVAAGSAVVAFVLLLPWSATVIGSGPALLGVSRGDAGSMGFGQVLRFDTGPVGKGPLGWALLVAAALPLVLGRGWRLAWAVRLWSVAIVFGFATWAGTRGWLPALPPEIGLAPAAVALALSVALGAVAFELDLPGYRFGWRQLAAGVAGVGLAVASVPVLIASGPGRWDLPNADANTILAFLPDVHLGDYRVLWVGAPDSLPMPGRKLDDGVAYAASYDGQPALADMWVPGASGAMPQMASVLHSAEGRLTTKLGHLLAPMAVLYVVVPNHDGPALSGAQAVPTPSRLLASLPLQTDLQLVNADANYVVYRNAAWAPAKMVLPASAKSLVPLSWAAAERSLQATNLAGATPVFTGKLRGSTIPQGRTVYVSATRGSGWRLHTAHAGSVGSHTAFGWAMAFTPPNIIGLKGATATLSRSSPLTTRAAQVFEIVLVFVALGYAAIDLRRRRSEHPPVESVLPEWFVPMAPASARPGWHRGSGGLSAADLTGDEVWIDA